MYFFETILYYFIVPTITTLLSMLVGLKIYYKFNNTKCKSTARLDGKVVLITGGNSGIGLETARDLASRGARVIIASRDDKKSVEAVADIIATTGNKDVEFKQLDLTNFASIRRFAEEFNSSYDRLDILINNTGCGALRHKITKDGFGVLMQINYIGHFYLTSLLINKIIASKPSKIINVASIAHLFSLFDLNDINGLRKRHYFLQYADAKLCLILWTKALAQRLPKGVTASAVHPGVVHTPIFKMYKILHVLFYPILGLFLKDSVEGAQASIFCAVSEDLAEKTGGYYCDTGKGCLSWKARDRDLINQVWDRSIEVTDAKNFTNL